MEKVSAAVCWVVFLVSGTAFAAEPTCVPRDDVVRLIEEGFTVAEIEAQLPPECFQSQRSAVASAPIKIANTGSVFWESIDSCGYHPQRRELSCDVEVRQRFGFAGTPPGAPGFNGPGSFEWLTFCADLGAGLEVIHTSAVHLHDEAYGVQPNWYYAITAQDNPKLHQIARNGRTLKARAILSWALIPNNCSYIPIWGNQADFQIKLDP